MRFNFNCASVLAAAAVFAAVAGGCARNALPVASQDDADRAGVTVAELEQGRELYVSRCSSCHLPVEPTKIAPAHWPGHVREMKLRSNLDDQQESLVVKYLVTMAERRPIE